MSQTIQVVIHESDTKWYGHKPDYDLELCSRCGKPIPEGEVPLMLWPDNKKKNWMYRFHMQCAFPNSKTA